jgi:hypothetical protein
MRVIYLWALICLLVGPALAQGPLYPNSVVSNDIDFIRAGDPSAYGCTRYLGQSRKEMPDKRGGDLFQDDAHVFEMQFRDGTVMEVWVSDAVTQPERFVAKLEGPLGKLPTMMRREIGHVVIHDGDETAFSEDLGHFFVLYTRNMEKLIRTNDLEETVFHEALHASVQVQVLKHRAWRRAVRRDKAFVTEYASTNAQEDFAESGLFAYTYLRAPERLPAEVRTALPEIMGARMAYFQDLFPSVDATHTRIGAYAGCTG